MRDPPRLTPPPSPLHYNYAFDGRRYVAESRVARMLCDTVTWLMRVLNGVVSAVNLIVVSRCEGR